MSYPGDEPDLDSVCEFLGLADDAESHATYSTEAHRCYRLPNPTRIASTHQETYCLGAEHTSCPVFRGEGVAQTTATATPPPMRPPVREAEPARSVPAPDRVAPSRAQRPQRPPRQPGTLGPRPRSGGISMPAATIGLLGLAIAIVGLAFVTQSILGGNGDETPLPGDTQATQQALAALQTATADAAAEATPDGTDTSAPGNDDADTDPTETPEVTPERPEGEFTYTVQSGDTCFALANHFGTTVAAIVAANDDLDEDCALRAGQEIIIPD